VTAEDRMRKAAKEFNELTDEHALERRLLASQAAQKRAATLAAASAREIELLHAQLETAHIELAMYGEPDEQTPKWMSKPPKISKAKNYGTLLLQISDTHYGEYTDPAQMGGYNAYNVDIAKLRTQRLFEQTIHIARTYFAGVEYDGIIVALGGDIVSGTIHDELEMTNELTIFESVKFAHDLLKPGLEMLAEEFKNLHIVSVPGNHGRHFRKVTHKGFTAQNADTAIAKWLMDHFADEKNITLHAPATVDAEFEQYGYKFSVEHGQAFRGGGAEIGSIGPVTRGTLRKGAQMTREGKPFEYLLLGHFHQYMPMLSSSRGYSVNGSLCGYDEYARGEHFAPEEPQQALSLIVPEFGVTHQTPIYVQNGEAEKW